MDLGLVTSLQAQTFGEPGQRTFRVLAETESGQVSIWLEKEQISMLGPAIDELLERVPDMRGNVPESDALQAFVGELEVKAGSLAIGFDADHDGFSLEAGEFVSSPFELEGITLLATRSQFSGVAAQIREIVAGGRPRCPLCGRPLGPEGHFCPPSNGHARIAASD